eukprot:CAMPEP_0119290840 /NCGR_PEP_ID=MMETSP1329-20130426/41405_1 /TAXON_ID=114041 /ORGANISM="Genus nov. species nov., Strain RCC1024" /LENGTH=154 /DNA_ID=CAMNT_0007291659 /DNA_START=250 /DNA_END=710 /DNA_ORIENTATION=+
MSSPAEDQAAATKTPGARKRKADDAEPAPSTPAAILHVSALRASSAGSLTPQERSDLYALVAEAVRALEDDSRAKADRAEEAREAKRQKAAAPEREADGARLESSQAPPILRRLPAAVASEALALLRAEDLRRMGALGAFRGAGGASVLRATVT